MPELPGLRAIHTVITPGCRVVQGGNLEAFDEAVRRIRAEYETLTGFEANREATYHLALNVKRPAAPDA